MFQLSSQMNHILNEDKKQEYLQKMTEECKLRGLATKL